MLVRLRNPEREIELSGDRTVLDLLAELAINPDTVLVIRDRDLLTRDERVGAQDRIEIRPVISGGAGDSISERASASCSPPRTGGP